MAEYRDSLGGRIYQNNGQWMYEDPNADRGEYYDADGRRMYKNGDQWSYTDDFSNRPASEAERAQGIFNQTGQSLHQTLDSARAAFAQSGIQQAYPQLTFEDVMRMQGQEVVDIGGEKWLTTPTRESGIKLGTQTGLGEALSMAGLAFGGMAGLSGLGLLGGQGALAGAGTAAGGGAAEIASLANLPGFGGVGQLAAGTAGATGAGAGALDFLNPQFTLDAAGNVTTGTDLFGNAVTGADVSSSVLNNTAGWHVNNAGQLVNGAATAAQAGPWAEYGLGLGPLAENASGLSGILDKVKNIPGGQSALSKIMSGAGTTDDWLKIAGQIGATGLGVLGSLNQSNALKDLANQNNALRKPYYDASLGYLNNPQSYFGGPVAQEAMRGMGAALSKNFGNVGESPTAQTMMLQGLAPSYWNTVSQLGNIGTGGQAAATAIGLEGVKSQGNIYNVLGAGLNDLTQPKPDYAKGVLDLFKNSLV